MVRMKKLLLALIETLEAMELDSETIIKVLKTILK